MLVTNKGISIAANDEQPRKARSPMLVTVSSTITLVTLGRTSSPGRSPV
jgi:hypothetical protein